MRLYLLRHAIAVPHGTPGYGQDAQRPLTEEGQAQALQIGEGLKRLNINPDLVVTSPYVRAAQTAEHVTRALGQRLRVEALEALRAEAEPSDTSEALAAFAGHDRLLLVGHEPHLSAWVAELVAGRGGMRCLMKKAGVACVEVERVPPPAGSGTLRWLLTPKHLALIGTAP